MDIDPTEQPQTPQTQPPQVPLQPSQPPAAPMPDPAQTPPLEPNLSREESILKSAGEGLEESVQPAEPVNQVVVPTGPKKSHKKLIGVLVALIIVGAAGASAYFVLGGKKTDAPTKVADTKPAVVTKPANTYTPDKINYAFRAKDTDLFSIYYRPSVGGQRTEVTKLDNIDQYPQSSVVKDAVAYAVGRDVFFSSDSGVTFKKIYTLSQTELANGILISNDLKRIAISAFDEKNITPTILFSINVDGKDKQEHVRLTETSLSPIGYNNTDQKIAYDEGCTQCDGPRTAYKIYDVKTKKSTDIVKVTERNYYNDFAISDDLSTFVFVTGDIYSGDQAGPGSATAAPYKVNVINLASGKAELASTMGKRGEKNPNGTDKLRFIKVGFMAGKNTPYFTDEDKLSKFEAGKVSLVYQADKNIFDVHYVGDKTAIVSTKASPETSDEDLVSYDRIANKTTNILIADANTSIFGVTTK